MQRLAPIALLLATSGAVFGSVDPELLGLVPENAKLIAGIDLTSAKNSDAGQYFLNRTQHEDQGFNEFIQRTGFDPRRDLQFLLFASAGPGAGGASESWAVIARGTFDGERLRALGAQKGGSIQDIQGVRVLVQNEKGSTQKTAICFPETGVAAMGDFSTVQNILANRATPSVLDPALQHEVDAVSGGNDVWVASLSSGPFLNLKNEPAQTAQVFQSIREWSGGLRFGSTVNLTLDAVARSPQDATSLADVIRFFAGMAQSQSQTNTQASMFASALSSLNLTTNGPSLHITLAIPEKTLEQLGAFQSDKAANGNAQRHPAQ